jgi:copper chaperone CopZ
MKKTLFITTLFINSLCGIFLQAQKDTKTIITQTLYVVGNCGQCKERIESAVDIKGVKFAEWNKKTKILTLTYKPSVISIDKIKNKILKAGHDTDSLKADEDAYNKLPECCKYRDVAPH